MPDAVDGVYLGVDVGTSATLWRLVKQAGIGDNLTRQGGAMVVFSPSGMPHSRCQSAGSD